MKVILCGANGFTGRIICKEFLRCGINFLAILRPGNDSIWMKENGISFRYADLNNYRDLLKVINGANILVSVASIGFGNVPSILMACKKANIERVIFTSTTAIFTKLNASSKKIRKLAEKQIKCSDLNWTIIRPTMIYGTPDDRNMIRLIKWIDKFPILPVVGDGNNLQQPIFVKDVARSIILILNNENTFMKSFNIAGAKSITYNEIINNINFELNKNCRIIYLPSKIVIKLFKILEKFKVKLPIKSEQLERLNENKSFNYDSAKKVFNFDPLSFQQGIKIEIQFYKNLKTSLI